MKREERRVKREGRRQRGGEREKRLARPAARQGRAVPKGLRGEQNVDQAAPLRRFATPLPYAGRGKCMGGDSPGARMWRDGAGLDLEKRTVTN